VDERIERLERELEEARRELEASRAAAAKGAFFQRIVESLTDPVMIVDPQRKVTYLSPAYETVTGRPASEFLGKDAGMFAHPDALRRIGPAFARMIAEGPGYMMRFEGLHQTGAGGWIHTDIHGRNMFDDPLIGGLLCIVRDATARKDAERSLGDSERMFRALFEDTSIAVSIRDVGSQQFLECNGAMLRLYGYDTTDALRGTTPDHLAPPVQPDGRVTRDVLREYVQRALSEGTARMEWMARRSNGEVFPAEVKTTVIALGEGRRVMQTMIEDVTERMRTVQAIEERSRRDDLVSRVSRQFVQSGFQVAMPIALEALGTFLGADRVRLRSLVENGETLSTLHEWNAPGVPSHPFLQDAASFAIFPYILERLRREGHIAVDDVDVLSDAVQDLRRRVRPAQTARAYLFLPLYNQGTLVGYLVVEQIDHPRHWSESDVATARLVTEIISMGGARAEAEAKTQRRAAHDELVGEVSRRFLNEDPNVATDLTIERLGVSFDAESVGLFALDERANRLRCTHRWPRPGTAPVGEGPHQTTKPADSLEDYPVPAGAFVRFDGEAASGALIESPEKMDSWLEALQRASGRRALYAPVGAGGKVFGLLCVRAREGRSWADDDALTLRMVGELIAVGRVRRAAEVALARATDNAIAANLTKSAFLANMSHELRTPLNGVIGMVDLLSGTPLDERQRRYTEIARASASLLLSVISDILDFSKIEAGKLELEAVPVNIHDLVEEVANILALGAEEKGLELTCHSDAALLTPFLGDPARIRQVLVNLVSNAVKFTKQGEVSVRATVVAPGPGANEAARVRVEVKDTGVGIPPEAQPRLFQPFMQVDASTTRVHGGTGLGLAICRQLIDRMRGAIGVISAPGAGSTFWFEVPFQPVFSLVGASASPAQLGPRMGDVDGERDGRLAGLRVLGVDDNATNREVLRAQLTAVGMICEVAADGPTALQMLVDAAEGQPYALVVADHHMPGMDGRELARRVKSDARLAATRVVMLGSVANPLGGAEQRADGIAGYCVKPIWKKELVRVLRGVLDAPVDGRRKLDMGRPPQASIPRAPTGARVLLVEDSVINAEVAGEILRTAGYEFDLAPDGPSAIDAVKARAYSLVLMDCQLPGMDGYEATRRIRALERHGEAPSPAPLPVVALTASATREDLDRCFEAGMNDHVSKPVDARRLLTIIAAYMKGAPVQVPRARDRDRQREPGADAVPVADIAGAVERLAGDRNLLVRLGTLFAGGAPAARDQLRAAVEARDSKQAVFVAHRLKGQAATFGGEALAKAAERLEDAVRLSDGEAWEAARACLLIVETELERLLRVLSSLAEEGADPARTGVW
jgi:PAS domain S-box-containing protein